jgi:hypothetical protein
LVTDDGFPLGSFWSGLVGERKNNQAAVEAVLAARPAAQAVYEREVAKYEAKRAKKKAKRAAGSEGTAGTPSAGRAAKRART